MKAALEGVRMGDERRPLAVCSDLESRQRGERQQRGYFTLEEAAQALGTQEGMHGGARNSLLERMVEAVRGGSLTVRDPHTDLPFRPTVVRVFYELVTPADVNAWLERAGVGYRWDLNQEAPAADAAGAAGEPEEAAIDAGAAREPGTQPLDTRTMAAALDGIDGRDAAGWRRLLGDRPKWAQDATVTPGARGREAATWDPVKLALLMLSKPGITEGRLSKMFRERPELEGWRGAWEAAQGAFSDYGI